MVMTLIGPIAPHQPSKADQTDETDPAPIKMPIVPAGSVHAAARLVGRSGRSTARSLTTCRRLRERRTPACNDH